MTKKEITTLLIVFSGGWLLVLGVIASLAAVPQLFIQVSSGLDGGGRHLLVAGLSLLPILFYGSLAYVLIRHCDALSSRLLAWGRIDGATVIQGGPVCGLAPLLFSVLGLYFLVENLPAFLLTAYRWFILEAGSGTQTIGGDVGSELAGLKAELAYYAVSVGIATFVLLRSNWIAGHVRMFSERDQKES